MSIPFSKLNCAIVYLLLLVFPSRIQSYDGLIYGIGNKSSNGNIAEPYDSPLLYWMFPHPGIGYESNISSGIWMTAYGEYNWGNKGSIFGSNVASQGYTVYLKLNKELFYSWSLIGASVAFNYEINRWTDQSFLTPVICHYDYCYYDARGTDEFWNLWVNINPVAKISNINLEINYGYRLTLKSKRSAIYSSNYTVPNFSPVGDFNLGVKLLISESKMDLDRKWLTRKIYLVGLAGLFLSFFAIQKA